MSTQEWTLSIKCHRLHSWWLSRSSQQINIFLRQMELQRIQTAGIKEMGAPGLAPLSPTI